ncbi:MAG: hypothetical protein HY360_13060 [Verrucomicrobia bacterium]|nr:hypothetical protein [Verrucomicrobiota bacterium]
MKIAALAIWLCIFTGCATPPPPPPSPAAPPTQPLTRYEILIPVVDEDGHPRAVFQRETMLRSIIDDFGGVVVDQHGTSAYSRDEQGDVRKDTHWRIIVDVAGKEHSFKVLLLLEQLRAAFETSEITIVRFPVERILQ